MLNRIGIGTAIAVVRHQRRSTILAASGIAVAAGGVSFATHCEAQQLHRPWQNDTIPLVPTLEAAVRAVRLVGTVATVVMEYEIAKYKPRMFQSSPNEDAELEALQIQMERKETDLEEAQIAYSTEIKDSSLSPTQRRALREEQKRRMQEAAGQLAEVEEQLMAMEGESSKSKLHRKAARRLLNLCRENGGVYIKVGQHLANLDYLIPQEYIEVMSTLFDDTPQSSYENVCRVIEEDLNGRVEDLFDRFDPKPIASASLAQVHVAFDKKTGRKLAVKVQHRGLRETSAGDIFTVTRVVRLLDKWFEDFTFGWIADEIAPHLPKELDFTREGKNSERAAENIAKTGLRCVIPKVIWTKTAPRVLTMEFEEGFKATDTAEIEKSGLNKHDIAKLVSSVFNSQVFISSWVHCDPHPANVLLRSKNGKAEMVLVDHGLYKQIDDKFRIRYARLWRSLMMADLKEIESSCHDMGVDKAYPLFAAMLTARPYDEIIERSKTGSFSAKAASPESQADRAVIRGYAKQFLKDIFVLLGTLPPQMLLLLKMNDCLRHIDFSLGSPTNTIVIAGKYAAKAVYEDQKKAASLSTRLRCWLQYMNVLVRIQIYDFGMWMIRVRNSGGLLTNS